MRNFGLATLATPGFSTIPVKAAARKGPRGNGLKHRTDIKNWTTRRGSWLQEDQSVSGGIILSEPGQLCRIVVSDKEHSAVQQAARMLAQDIEKITGRQPEIVSKSANSEAQIYLTTLGNESVPDGIEVRDIEGQWEAHKIVTLKNAVWLIGADYRGTAFAAYTLSERLGVDPLYLWTGYVPVRHDRLILKPTTYVAPAPTFKYRGFFHDDEDILPRPYDRDGYPLKTGDVDLDWYKTYFETALRLRMNMVAPYTRVHRRYEIQQCAGEWGLLYTSHHYDILLSNPYGFQRFNLAEKRKLKPDWDWKKNRAGMTAYWKGGVTENRNLDCIWPVGLRGMGDATYNFPKDATPAQKVALFNEVIKEQISIVKKTVGSRSNPPFTLTLWDEVMDIYKNNRESFDLPDDVIIVWSDNMNGQMNDLPESPGKWKHGIYYHLAMYGGWVTKQSAHIVSPATITEAIRKTVEAKATEFILTNVSEMREFVMGARLLSDICWDAPSLLNKKEPDLYYTKWWSNEYFGPDATDDVARVYQQYFRILSKPGDLWYAADIIRNQLYQLGKKYQNEPSHSLGVEENWTLETRAGMYQDVMEDYQRAIKNMDRQQQQYFFENVRLGLSFDWRPTQTALLLEKAIKESDTNKSWQYVFESIRPLEQLELDILRAERPPFDHWYEETWVRNEVSSNNVHRSYLFLRAFISSGGKIYQFPTEPFRTGNENTREYQEWTKFIERMERIKEQ